MDNLGLSDATVRFSANWISVGYDRNGSKAASQVEHLPPRAKQLHKLQHWRGVSMLFGLNCPPIGGLHH